MSGALNHVLVSSPLSELETLSFEVSCSVYLMERMVISFLRNTSYFFPSISSLTAFMSSSAVSTLTPYITVKLYSLLMLSPAYGLSFASAVTFTFLRTPVSKFEKEITPFSSIVATSPSLTTDHLKRLRFSLPVRSSGATTLICLNGTSRPVISSPEYSKYMLP